MFEEFEKGVPLRDLIVEILRAGPLSISQVGQELAKRGVKLHRLAVAGYLKALADTGVLEEREIPPAKVYAPRAGDQRRDIYRRVAERCRDEARPPWDAASLFVEALQLLLRRPIFREEIARGGFDVPRGAAEVVGEERGLARRALGKSPLKLPFNDPAFRMKPADEKEHAILMDAARNLLDGLLREELRAQALAMTTKQATLGADES